MKSDLILAVASRIYNFTLRAFHDVVIFSEEAWKKCSLA
jgi:hypothetical protein